MDTINATASLKGQSSATAKGEVFTIPRYDQLQKMSEENLIEQYNKCLLLKMANKPMGDFAGFWLDEISRRHQEVESKRMLKITYISLAISVIATIASVIAVLQTA